MTMTTSPISYDAVASHDTSHEHSHSHSTTSCCNEQHDHTVSSQQQLGLDRYDHDGGHSHSHAHEHHGHKHDDDDDDGTTTTTTTPHNSDNPVMKRLKIATGLCITFFLVEVTGGYVAGSLAVLSDAAHLLADLASFAVAIVASHLGSLPTTDQHTFGLKRVESLAALFSMISLALVSVGLALEAVRRLVTPPPDPVDGPLMSGIATIGVVVNVTLAVVLGEHHVHMPGGHHDHDHSHGHSHGHDDHGDDNNSHHVDDDDDEIEMLLEQGDGGGTPSYQHQVQHTDELPPPPSSSSSSSKRPTRNINLHAAYLHVLGDLAQSVAVLIAGLVIWAQPTWTVVDPICTLLFCALVFYSTLGVLRSSISVLLEEVPPNLNWRRIHNAIEDVDGVAGVHDLHIWSISHSVPTLSVHCFSADPEQALANIYCVCKQYGVVHATIQVQEGDGTQDCITCTGEGKACHSLETSKRNCSLH